MNLCQDARNGRNGTRSATIMSGLLNNIYSSLPVGGDASADDRIEVDSICGEGAATYGEIEAESARRLLSWMALEENETFVDCGSGIGRLVVQAAIETKVGLAVGVEMSRFRHKVAVRAKELLEADPDGRSYAERTAFIQGDFREYLPKETSVIYAGSLCFPPVLMDALAAQCTQLPKFRLLCTLKELPESWRHRFREKGGLDLGMTWSADNRVFVYGRK